MKKEKLTITIEKEKKERLKELKKSGISISVVVNNLLDKYLEKEINNLKNQIKI